MRETTVLCEVVCEAEPAEVPNWADFALRCDDELCAHDGESRIGVFDASESGGRTRHARRGRLHSRYRRSSGGLPVITLQIPCVIKIGGPRSARKFWAFQRAT